MVPISISIQDFALSSIMSASFNLPRRHLFLNTVVNLPKTKSNKLGKRSKHRNSPRQLHQSTLKTTDPVWQTFWILSTTEKCQKRTSKREFWNYSLKRISTSTNRNIMKSILTTKQWKQQWKKHRRENGDRWNHSSTTTSSLRDITLKKAFWNQFI